MFWFRNRGSFRKTEKFLKKSLGKDYLSILTKYGEKGVSALSSETPVDTGLTASSWSYEIIQNADGFSVVWNNSNIHEGVNIALILQYGHGTKNGAWIEGRDYINPALKPILDELADAAWKEVKSL